jgi:hypothetical protein
MSAGPFNATVTDSVWIPVHGSDDYLHPGQSVVFSASASFWMDNKATGNVTTGSPGATGRASLLPVGVYAFDLLPTDFLYVRAQTGQTFDLEGVRTGLIDS